MSMSNDVYGFIDIYQPIYYIPI